MLANATEEEEEDIPFHQRDIATFLQGCNEETNHTVRHLLLQKAIPNVITTVRRFLLSSDSDKKKVRQLLFNPSRAVETHAVEINNHIENTNTFLHHLGKVGIDTIWGATYGFTLGASGEGCWMLLNLFWQHSPVNLSKYDGQLTYSAMWGAIIFTAAYSIGFQSLRALFSSPRSTWLDKSMTAKEAAHIFIAVVFGVAYTLDLFNGKAESNKLGIFLAGIVGLSVLHKILVWFGWAFDTGENLWQQTPQFQTHLNHSGAPVRTWNWRKAEDTMWYGDPGAPPPGPNSTPIMQTPVQAAGNAPPIEMQAAQSRYRKYVQEKPDAFFAKLLLAVEKKIPSARQAQEATLSAIANSPIPGLNNRANASLTTIRKRHLTRTTPQRDRDVETSAQNPIHQQQAFTHANLQALDFDNGKRRPTSDNMSDSASVYSRLANNLFTWFTCPECNTRSKVPLASSVAGSSHGGGDSSKCYSGQQSHRFLPPVAEHHQRHSGSSIGGERKEDEAGQKKGKDNSTNPLALDV